MLTTGTVGYEVGGNIDATCFGGIAAAHRLVTRLGLPEQVNQDLELLKVHQPYHESDHVLNLAYNVLCGGTRLEDIERLRHDTAYMNALGADLIPDPTTAGDFAAASPPSTGQVAIQTTQGLMPANCAVPITPAPWPAVGPDVEAIGAAVVVIHADPAALPAIARAG